MALLVSIIIPTYNQSKYLQECISSVKNQTYSHFQAIIINDGSTDDTEKIVEKSIESDDRFIYIYQNNSGVSAARNTGLNTAIGEYICFLDGDDWWEPNFLEVILDKELCEIGVCDATIYFQHKKTSKPMPQCKKHFFTDVGTFLENWDETFTPAIHSVVIKRSLLAKYRFPEGLHGWEELTMWVCILRQAPKIFVINQSLVWYRKHSNNKTSVSSGLAHLNNSIIYIYQQLDNEEKVKWIQKIIRFFDNQLIYQKNENDKFTRSPAYLVYKAINKLKGFVNA